MNTLTVHQVENNFRKIVEQILADVEPTVIITEEGESIVMLPLDEYNAWQETLYLLSTPANAEHLRQSIAEDQAGYTTKHELIEP